ncbi:MAG: MBL fold metallo-hydrolase [Calditrichaeota bacterium]|nr:MAG: MBL fold metallo-hydrolase [Calditrichota bacterium]
MFFYDKGIKINGSSLWLDAQRVVQTCCVTHGHMDHARRHDLVIATKKTIRILQERVGKMRAIPLEFKQRLHLDGCTVRFFPAGHILGSAQILVENHGLRLLYSGDFNLHNCATAEAIEIPESDVLIMECTFGRPFYRFPQRAVVEQQLLDFVQRAFAQKAVPVVLAYALGKAQSAMKILGDAGFEMSVHTTIARLAKIYEEFGVDLGRWSGFKKSEIQGKVLVMPRHVAQTRLLQKIPNRRTVFLTGWAVNPGTKQRCRVDEALPLSDHADFDGLLEYARRVNPKRIYVTHGFSEFAQHLKRAGFDARPLKTANQLSLF